MGEAATYTNTTLIDGVQIQRWNSPVFYLFGGLALMLALVATALLILACSYRKSSSSNDDEKPSIFHELEGDNQPKIVVIMPGDDNPTYLAKPLPSPMLSTPNFHRAD